MAARPRKFTLAQILEQAGERIQIMESHVGGVMPETPYNEMLREYLKKSRDWIDVRATRLPELKKIKLDPHLSQQFGIKLVELEGVYDFDVTCKIVGAFLSSTHEIIGLKYANYAEAGRTLSVLPGEPDVPYEPPSPPLPLQPGVSMSGDSDVPVVFVLPDSTRRG